MASEFIEVFYDRERRHLTISSAPPRTDNGGALQIRGRGQSTEVRLPTGPHSFRLPQHSTDECVELSILTRSKLEKGPRFLQSALDHRVENIR